MILYEFEANLFYIMNYRPARATYQDSHLQAKKRGREKEEKRRIEGKEEEAEKRRREKRRIITISV